MQPNLVPPCGITRKMLLVNITFGFERGKIVLKSKLLILVLIVVFALATFTSCTTVNAPTIPTETNENNNNSATTNPSYYPEDVTPDINEHNSLDDGGLHGEGGDLTSVEADANSGVEHGDTDDSEIHMDASETNSVLVPTRAPAARLVTAPSSMKIALTFDDGPAAYTTEILDLLVQHGGRVTFFVTGSRVEANSDIIRRAFDMGNEIANHSWSHARFTRISDDQIRSEIQRTSDAIRSVTGVSPAFYRPPYGSTDDRVVRVSAEMGYSIIKWTLDTLDWRHRNPYFTYRAIIDRVEPGSVILLHDIHATTAEAMRYVIPDLIARGYELVTVSELIEYIYGELAPGQISGWYVQR